MIILSGVRCESGDSNLAQSKLELDSAECYIEDFQLKSIANNLLEGQSGGTQATASARESTGPGKVII